MTNAGGYRTPTAFRQAADVKLKKHAVNTGRPFLELRREFLYQRFLARVFAGGEAPWVLKGGFGLLTRLPGARHSRDIDLMHLVADSGTAEGELRQIGRREFGDHLRFEVTKSSEVSVADALTVTCDAYVGANKWESFSVDVSCERHFVAQPELVEPTPRDRPRWCP